MVLAISVTIGEEEVSLDINEAKELYEDLKRLFERQEQTSNGLSGLYVGSDICTPTSEVRYRG